MKIEKETYFNIQLTIEEAKLLQETCEDTMETCEKTGSNDTACRFAEDLHTYLHSLLF